MSKHHKMWILAAVIAAIFIYLASSSIQNQQQAGVAYQGQ